MAIRRAYVDVEHLVLDHVSGVGQYTAGLLGGVAREQGHRPDIEVAIGTYWRWLDRLDRFPLEGLRRRRFPVPLRVSNVLKERRKLPPIDLIMGRAVYLFPNYVAWPTVMSPTIPFVYDLSFVHHAQYVHPRNRDFLNALVPRSVAKAAKVLTISEHSRGEIVAEYGLDPERVFVCYPAVDTARYRRADADVVEHTKARYGIHGDYLLFVGNIEPRKGLRELLLAYERLDADLRERYALLLIGAKGWLDDDITDTIVRLRMAGNRILRPSDYVVDTDLPALYSGASLFAYPSHYEGFGMPPVEAMACGVPVVTADNSALPEAVGDAALKVDSHDIDALAGSITKVLRDPALAADLVARGHQQVARFDYGQSARVLLDAIASVA